MPEFTEESTDVNSGLSSLWPQLPNGHADSVPHQAATGNFFKKVRNGDVITGVVKTIKAFHNTTLHKKRRCIIYLHFHPLVFPWLLQTFSFPSAKLPTIVASVLMNQYME